MVFCIAVAATAVGSGWYHLAPNDVRIDWDRLPIALACAGMVGAVVTELFTLSRRHAVTLLISLAAYAVLSVFCVPLLARYGVNDLRLYLLIQLAAMILIPLLQWAYRAPRAERRAFGLAVGGYVLAKLSEVADRAIFDLGGGLVSGHTLKHLLSTLACAAIVWSLHHRWVREERRWKGAYWISARLG